jgi:hypothetical protein
VSFHIAWSGTIGGVMQWFSREWRDGALSDEEWQQRLDDYAIHAAALRSDLPLDQAWLLDLDVHDGQVQSWQQSGGQFSWVLLTGDLQRGYRLTSLHYFDAHLTGADTENLNELLLGPRSELLYDEVSQVGEQLEHRFLFDPNGEFGVRFRHASVSYAPAESTMRR